MAGSTPQVAIISDGTTSLTFAVVSEAPDKLVSRSVKTSSAGRHKVQVAGYRINIDVKLRMTPAEYNAFKSLMISGALEYFYTPFAKDTHPIYVGAEIPIKCTIRADEKDFDNIRINHVNLQIRGSNLFTC